MIQLSGDVANKASVESQQRERQVNNGCRSVPVRLRMFVNFCLCTTKESSRPTAKHASQISPLVVLTLERLRLVLRRERASPVLLLRWSHDFLLSFCSSLLRSNQLLLCSLSLSLSVCCSGFCSSFSLVQQVAQIKEQFLCFRKLEAAQTLATNKWDMQKHTNRRNSVRSTEFLHRTRSSIKKTHALFCTPHRRTIRSTPVKCHLLRPRSWVYGLRHIAPFLGSLHRGGTMCDADSERS